ncbi:hypothetical protein MIND_01377900 [Mycena indigotica]|uniref:P-loop containing nucleoside triphosphate hydrolase protein n=1 Tax=Mycena indigotica TaxID=2126181 RepID=A0A8H6RYC1_9AGAR|nr:uncharacterized protein MIND_01377900 [Mycena indigotica]KAF7289168.1 hypothetical protein MIND_01377900 [Mycena indigotica]
MASLVTRLLGSLHTANPPSKPGHVASSVGLFSALGEFVGSANALFHAYGGSSIKLLMLGSVIETGRRIFRWFITRFSIEYCTTIRLNSGDPAYEWVVLLLTQENVWRRSREFVVTANNSRRKWAVRATTKEEGSKINAEYVPTYQRPQLFRWRGYWVEIQRLGNVNAVETPAGPYGGQGTSMSVTIYTLDMNVLSDFVEDAYDRYVQVNRPHVVVHMIDSNFGPNQLWTSVKHKMKRPLSSIILPTGVVDSIVEDAKEFINTENWYAEAGIPHRRGYLLYGPPGTGKTSTIYALAGALNLEIYVLSLSSRFVDDAYLQRAASAIPKHGIFVIEDIDCAFPSRDDDDDMDDAAYTAFMHNTNPHRSVRGMARMAVPAARTAVTLSGLLNVIDGVGSEEGKLFFATTNHIERLDPALLRPGRIDVKLQYEYATRDQAEALFTRFFPERRFPQFTANGVHQDEPRASPPPAYFRQPLTADLPDPDLDSQPLTLPFLANVFASRIPPGEFTTAELQGYLQGFKTAPVNAVRGALAWVERERTERDERMREREQRRIKVKERRAAMANAAPGLTVSYTQPPASATRIIPGSSVVVNGGPAVPMVVPGVATPPTAPVVTVPQIPETPAHTNGMNGYHGVDGEKSPPTKPPVENN